MVVVIAVLSAIVVVVITTAGNILKKEFKKEAEKPLFYFAILCELNQVDNFLVDN